MTFFVDSKKLALASLLSLFAVAANASMPLDYNEHESKQSQEPHPDDRQRLDTFRGLTSLPVEEETPGQFGRDVRRGRLAREHFFALYSADDFGPDLAELDRDSLLARYRAAEHTAFWSQSVKALDWLEQAFDVRYQRGDLDQRQIDMAGGLFLWNREFERAKEFQERINLSQPSRIPTIVRDAKDVDPDSSTVPVWRLDGEADALVLDHLTLSGKQLVITMDNRCGPSQQALASIKGEPDLLALIQEHGVLLHGPSSMLDFDRIANLNQANPTTPIVLVDNVKDWPQNRSWATPTFHVFDQGEVVGYSRSWRDLDYFRAWLGEFFELD